MSATQIQVLLAVPDTVLAASIAEAFMRTGAAVSAAQVRYSDDLIDRVHETRPDLLVVQLNPEIGSLEQLRVGCPGLPMIAVIETANHTFAETASSFGVTCWSLPMDAEQLTESAREAIAEASNARTTSSQSGLEVESDGRRVSAASSTEPPVMVGNNPKMLEVRETIRKVAGTDVTVLVRGESGVGKEIVARLLFDQSRRRHKPFVKVNCAAIPHDLLESELFGYETGAFTGAVRPKPGKFELADGGTLFLDEIAEMHPMLQAKLLHVLQDGRFSRLGAKRDISVDVRVICATNKLLEERVREGLFREDLLYRINVVSIFIPPLRERSDEIAAIAQYLLMKFAAQYGRPQHAFGHEVMQRMLQYDWPGNIRELENMCKRFVIVGSETQILRELSSHNGLHAAVPSATASPMLLPESAPSPATEPLSLLEVGRRAAWQAEKKAILDTLEATRWNRREASRRLQVSYKALLNKIKQMELEDGGASAEINGEKSAVQ